MSMSPGEATPSVPPVALVGRGGEEGVSGTPVCQAWTWKPVVSPLLLKDCPPLGEQHVEGDGRRLVSSCKEARLSGPLLELGRGTADWFPSRPNALPQRKPLRPRLFLSPSPHFCLSTTPLPGASLNPFTIF